MTHINMSTLCKAQTNNQNHKLNCTQNENQNLFESKIIEQNDRNQNLSKSKSKLKSKMKCNCFQYKFG